MGFVFDKKPTIEIDGRLYECDPTDINLIEGVSQNYPKILALGIEFEEMKKQLLDTRKNAKEIQANNEAFVQKNKELLVECQSFISGSPVGGYLYKPTVHFIHPGVLHFKPCLIDAGQHRTPHRHVQAVRMAGRILDGRQPGSCHGFDGVFHCTPIVKST